MENDSSLDFNFWTAFADLMLSLVLVLSLLLFIVTAVISFGSVNLKQVEDNQNIMIETLAGNYKTTYKLLNNDESLKKKLYGISTAGTDSYDIKVLSELNTQTLTFSDKLLFKPDKTVINEDGEEVLTVVGNTLRNQLSLIKEIQIQGHADTQKSGRFRNNTELAAMRAIAVFEFLQNRVGIDPNQTLMSATSFGEFKSVKRAEEDNLKYDRDKLLLDNADDIMRGYNRRIEIVLIYHRGVSIAP